MKNDPVYQEWAHQLIKSTHGSRDTHYRVFLGTVSWSRKPEHLKPAIVVFMQYGSTDEWTQACRNKEIAFNLPAHILEDDAEKVLAVIEELRQVNKIRKG